MIGSASAPFPPGTAAACGGTLALNDGSDLLTLRLLFDSSSGGTVFSAAEIRRFCPPCLADPLPEIVRPFAFSNPWLESSGAWFGSGTAAPCWCTVATVTLRVTVFPPASKHTGVLTRIAVVSWTGFSAVPTTLRLAPVFAGAGGVRPPPEGLVKVACRRAFRPCRGTGPPAGTDLSPVTRDYPIRRFPNGLFFQRTKGSCTKSR